MDLFNTRSVEEAQEILKRLSDDVYIKEEKCALMDSLHRVLSKPIESPHDVPGFDRSTVDGYAVKASDTYGASESMPSMLTYAGEVLMGKPAYISIGAGECAYVPTGGMLPEGSDAVVMVEHVEKMDDETILIHQPITVGANTLKKGEDIHQGMVILDRGHKLRPQDLGLLAGMGYQNVTVFQRLKVGIISTGDEIISPGGKLEPGKIIDMNTYSLSSAVIEDGCDVYAMAVVPDELDLLKDKMAEMMETCHLILVSGGSSMGHRDVTKEAIDSLGKPGVVVHGIAVKPGKPTIIGKAESTLMIGLPGQPVSALVVYRILVRPMLDAVLGNRRFSPTIRGRLTVNVPSAPGREHYVMVSIDEYSDNNHIYPVHGKSGMMSMMSRAQGYIKIEKDQEGLSKGSEVNVHLF
ncbi:MAG: molybdopterin molybdenumtransferase MoeA [Tindallia sp. MSAO_Bac2]|nr:MAG: molybdopterin molybdenumtransferase MoeA [Tindallia sp. MSAO_Bac2]